MMIYHYCRQDAAEKIIWDNTIMFTNPAKFNDPFDADIELLTFKMHEASQEVLDEIELLKKTPEMVSLQKMLPTFSVNVIIDNDHDLVEKSYQKAQQQKISLSSVACFSRRHDNTLMWSHYGDSHHGIALGFSLEIQPILIDGEEGLMRGPVEYKSNLNEKANYLKDKVNGIKRLFLTKSVDWRYEKEFRLILLNKQGPQKYNPLFLRRIIFGLRCTESEIEKVKALALARGMNHLEFYRMKKEDFRLKKTKI